MKFVFGFLFLVITSTSFSQNFFQKKFEILFPNTKKKQIEHLQVKNDSLQLLTDSLYACETIALDKINHLKKENLSLKTELFDEQQKSKNANSNLLKEVSILKDSIQKMNFTIVRCTEDIVVKKGLNEPILINTCSWRDYQIIEKGTPDYKGRYTWVSEYNLKKGDSTIKIKNTDFFKPEKLAELELFINNRFAEDFKSLKEMDAECFRGLKNCPKFKMKDMRIAFNDNAEISFEILYGLSNACYAVNASSTTFKIIELKAYFVE